MALVVVGMLLVLGFALGAPIFAIPVVLLLIAGYGALNFYRRVGKGSRLGEFRGQRYRASPGRDVHLTGRAPRNDG
jgi:hypothetical protein